MIKHQINFWGSYLGFLVINLSGNESLKFKILEWGMAVFAFVSAFHWLLKKNDQKP